VLLFIAGFTVVFAAFGATASSLGRFLAQNLPLATRIAGGVIIAFGLVIISMSWRGRGPLGWFERDTRIQVRPSRLGAWAAPVMGAAFAFGWTPCIGPILTVILATAATQETIGRGIALLVAYSLGLGLPFLLAALGLHKVYGRMRPHLRTINLVAGVALTTFGVVMITGNINRISSFVSDLFTGIPFLENLTEI
jgi:cytochrome c-type biogenesis protein